MKSILSLICALLLFSCQEQKKEEIPVAKQLETGSYRASLEVQDNKVLPFVFEVTDAQHIKVFNAEEIIETNEVRYQGDSVFIKMPVFEGYIAAKNGQ